MQRELRNVSKVGTTARAVSHRATEQNPALKVCPESIRKRCVLERACGVSIVRRSQRSSRLKSSKGAGAFYFLSPRLNPSKRDFSNAHPARVVRNVAGSNHV